LNKEEYLLKILVSQYSELGTSVLFPIEAEFSEQQGRVEKSYINLY